MLVHILLMNAIAPVAALALRGAWLDARHDGRRYLFTAMAVQLALIWAWHSPPALQGVSHSAPMHLLMQGTLFLGALWFWSAVFHVRDDRRWRSILALLLTSKLFCLLGVLLVFAPRMLYPDMAAGGAAHGGMSHGTGIEDQQLAGLLMLIACPATYVLAGILIAARWFGDMEEGTTEDPAREARRVA